MVDKNSTSKSCLLYFHYVHHRPDLQLCLREAERVAINTAPELVCNLLRFTLTSRSLPTRRLLSLRFPDTQLQSSVSTEDRSRTQLHCCV